MLATRSLTEEQVRAGMLVSLPSETSKGLSKTEVDEVKLLVHLSKEAGETAGQAMMACAEHLSAVKAIVKKKGWTALCDSGALGMGSKQAQMLALCHERLFVTGSIPSTAVANVSITTLYLMASADDKKKGEMVAALVEAGGSGFTEKEARAIKNKGKTKKAVKASDFFDKAKLQEKLEGMSTGELHEEVVVTTTENMKYKLNIGGYIRRIEQLKQALIAAGVAVPKPKDMTDEIAEAAMPEIQKAIGSVYK